MGGRSGLEEVAQSFRRSMPRFFGKIKNDGTMLETAGDDKRAGHNFRVAEEEVAGVLNVSYLRATALVREGILPTVHLGRQKRIDPRKLEEFIQAGGKALPGGWRRKPPDDAEQGQAEAR